MRTAAANLGGLQNSLLWQKMEAWTNDEGWEATMLVKPQGRRLCSGERLDHLQSPLLEGHAKA